jgi:hypothetical protein
MSTTLAVSRPVSIVPVPTQSGGRLEVHGSLKDRRLFVFLSRESLLKDDAVAERICRHFVFTNRTFIRYESDADITLRLINGMLSPWQPTWLRQLLKTAALLAAPHRWRHFSRKHRERIATIQYRAQALYDLVQYIGRGKEIVLIGRSAGARVASLVADGLLIYRVICLGYPFENPDAKPELERVKHLEHVQTPMLILQGVRDNYGGADVTTRYRFSPDTVVEIVDTDHAFNLREDQWLAVLHRMDEFVGN